MRRKKRYGKTTDTLQRRLFHALHDGEGRITRKSIIRDTVTQSSTAEEIVEKENNKQKDDVN